VLSKLAVGAVVVCSYAAFAASGASAACTPPGCVTLSFNHALLDAGGTPANIVTPSTAPLTADANITGSSGTGEANYAVDPSGVSFPSYNFSVAGFTGTINTTLAKTATGTINFVSGAVTMAADFSADVHLNGVTGDCTLDTGPVNLSTANTQPLMGVAFPAGQTGPVTGAGAFGGTWPTVTTSPSGAEACTLLAVGGLTGPGGLWISRNLTPPSPTVTHNKLKAVKAGKTEAVKIKVANSGQVGTGAIKLCLKVPKHFKVNKKCQTVTNVAAGKTDVVTFKVKTSKKHRPKHTKTYKLTLTPSTTTEGLMGNKGLAAQAIKFKVKH
jgi:hypothetical protein